jgi:IS1 family transposase
VAGFQPPGDKKIKTIMANHLTSEKKAQAVSLLCEDSSIRAVERITGVHRDTVMRLAVRVGEACRQIADRKMRELSCKNIEIDEAWGFVGSKQKNAIRTDNYGDVWTFVGLDVDSKLVPSFIVGKRDAYHAKAFMSDLASRLKERVQISSDALAAYPDAVEYGFGPNADYAQVVKTFSVSHLGNFIEAAQRYSPAEVVEVELKRIMGSPVKELISTSHVEKQNHTLRMHVRRLTRLTNAFSKKLENFEAAIALHFAYYNFCKIHSAVRCTPAMAAGVESSQWSVEELVERCGE